MLNTKREEKALLEFKSLMDDLLMLLGRATGVQTGYLCWVNRSRRQFVLETTYTTVSNVMFQDRVLFDKSFLNRYKNLDKIVQLEVGRDLSVDELEHYYNGSSVRYLLVIPFRNNDETVALTVLESQEKLSITEQQTSLAAYNRAHINVLNTYLELTGLYEDQKVWTEFDEVLEKFKADMGATEVLELMLFEMQRLIAAGGVVVALRGMDTWVTVLRSGSNLATPSIGLLVEVRSLAHDALSKGEPVFSMHFNHNPKRISSSEFNTEGASFAIPLLIAGRRYAVIVVNSKNPLIFTESIKHQLRTLVKVASLTIENLLLRTSGLTELFVSEYGSFISELWEASLNHIANREDHAQENAWFGLAGIENLSEIRSRHRLEDLKKMQRYLVKALNPARTGYKGLIGFHSDYVYSYIFVSRSENHHQEWIDKTIFDLKNSFKLDNGQPVHVDIKFGSVKVIPGKKDVQQIIIDAKKALGFAMKDNVTVVNL